MSITSDIELIKTNVNEGNKAIDVVNEYQKLDGEINNHVSVIDGLASGSSFDSIPADLKAAAIKYRTELKAFQTTLQEADFQELING